MGVPSADARFSALFEEYYPHMRDYCLRRLSIEDTNDALGDIFLVAWRKIDKVPAGEEARPWLYAVARNVVANRARTRRRAARLQNRLNNTAVEGQEPPIDRVIVRRSEDQELIEAVSRLGTDDREILRLKMWDELSHAEIGTVLGITTHAVDMRASRAIKRLARLLQDPKPRFVSPRPIEQGGER